jgi:hypothetical protein
VGGLTILDILYLIFLKPWILGFVMIVSTVADEFITTIPITVPTTTISATTACPEGDSASCLYGKKVAQTSLSHLAHADFFSI